MINVKTLQKVQQAQECITKCKRTLDDVKEFELDEAEWVPGHGEKPHKARELERMLGDLSTIFDDLERLYS